MNKFAIRELLLLFFFHIFGALITSSSSAPGTASNVSCLGPVDMGCRTGYYILLSHSNADKEATPSTYHK